MPFENIFYLLFRKSVKSLQLMLNEWSVYAGDQISASAYSQARHKFRHTAFIELLEKSVVDVMYGNGDYKTYKGYRLLGLDGSSLRLPNTRETRNKFGVIEHMNGRRSVNGVQVEAKMTVLYDLLNKIPISAHLHQGRANDLKASKVHLCDMKKGDIVIADRAYGSYQFFAEILDKNADFVIRCKHKTFEKYHNLFSSTIKNDVTVEIKVPYSLEKQEYLPKCLHVRFLRIMLDNGEVEVLATSLLDKNKFSHRHFKKLYYQRWKVETYFQILKSRLCIDNFTGKSVEAIYQDFYSTIFVSGLETIITNNANQTLNSRKTTNQLKVNKAVSFHTIKNNVISLILNPTLDVSQKIEQLFLQTPTAIRPNRPQKPRMKIHRGNDRRALYYQRYTKKHVF